MIESTSPVVLQLQHVSGHYGETQALHDISLQVQEGEIVCLLGRNGAGKTTTLRAIVGLLARCQGTIEIHGQSTVGLPPEAIAHLGVAYCPEERGIFASLTTEENLLLPPVLKPGGLTVEEIYELFPNLLARRSSQGTKLSGGEQQMLAIARILRTGAKFLLLDECTEGLAPVIVERIGQVIRLLRERGFTVLMVEQNFRFAAPLADRHYVLEHGEIIETIEKDDLQSKMDWLHQTLGV